MSFREIKKSSRSAVATAARIFLSRLADQWLRVKIKNFLEGFGLNTLASAIAKNQSVWELAKKVGALDIEAAREYMANNPAAAESIRNTDSNIFIGWIAEALPDYAALLEENPEWIQQEIDLIKRDLL